ncbi:MAG: 7-carboxy-7-deazaguanine synthase QueE [Gammaproteobacteria bacterium]|nr:7-carboxy-7-deazaguanine synthase QueE [Gammaproteobacteria bacterium]
MQSVLRPASRPTSRLDGTHALRVTEIFYSLQGEADTVGWPTVFVRLTGCPLRCHYCDTSYAFHGEQRMPEAAVVAAVSQYSARYVTVTGGEPMMQKGCVHLLATLCDAAYQVSLETSGAVDLSAVDSRVVKVMDIKTPGSGEMAKNRVANIELLVAKDQVKFVICDRADYLWAVEQLGQHRLNERCQVLFGTSQGQLEDVVLADWILEDRLPVRFQTQLHKQLWGNMPGK